MAEKAEKKAFVLKLAGHAGDVLMARPVLRAFRRAHPTDSVYFETRQEFHDLMAGQRDADFVWPIGKSKGSGTQIDMCNFRAKPWARERVHIMDAMAEACGIHMLDRSYGFAPPADVDRWAKSESQRLGKFAVFHSRSSSPSKDWPASRLSTLAGMVSGKLGLRIVQVGGNDDLPVEGAEDLRGTLSLSKGAALMSRASLFVGPDSLPMHLSRAVRPVPAVILWGSTSPITSGLFGPSVANLEPARMCGHDGRPCHTRCDWTEACVDRTGVDEAFAACERFAAAQDAKVPDVTVVLVNWNSWAGYTRRTLRALDATMKSDWDLVLVDNGSKEDAAHLEAWTHPRLAAKVLNSKNEGLPAAWNASARRARGRVVLFMNTDVEILEEGWDLKALDLLRRRPACGVLGVSENEPPLVFGESWARTEASGWGPGAETRCHHVNGSCLFVRRSVLDRVGPFDERFTPGYCEETDFCLRAILMGEEVWHLGGLVRHERHGVVVKANGAVIGPVIARNNAYFARKWEGARVPPAPESQVQDLVPAQPAETGAP